MFETRPAAVSHQKYNIQVITSAVRIFHLKNDSLEDQQGLSV